MVLLGVLFSLLGFIMALSGGLAFGDPSVASSRVSLLLGGGVGMMVLGGVLFQEFFTGW